MSWNRAVAARAAGRSCWPAFADVEASSVMRDAAMAATHGVVRLCRVLFRLYSDVRRGMAGCRGRPCGDACGRASAEGNTRLPRDVAQLFDHCADERDALTAADRFGLALRIARDERPVRPGRRPRLPQGADHVVDLSFELVLVDE